MISIFMRILLFILFIGPIFGYGQFQFSGQLYTQHSGQKVYLSIVENYRKSARVYQNQIIGETSIDSLGNFTFEGDNLSDKNHLYRIHTDECPSTQKTSHFLKECSYTQSLLFIANNSDTISLPLLENNQALCNIITTNEASQFILETDALREEMILDFMDYPTEANENLNFKKWFERFQEFGTSLNEPIAELYIYDFLSDRDSETHSYYLKDLLSNPYYEELLIRLQKLYPNASFTAQYERELYADKSMQGTSSSTPKDSLYKYLFLAVATVLLILFGFLFLRKKKKQHKTKHLALLTGQERVIAEKIAQGKSNKEIASELFISLSTVKTHINNLYKKLHISSRDDLKAYF